MHTSNLFGYSSNYCSIGDTGAVALFFNISLTILH